MAILDYPYYEIVGANSTQEGSIDIRFQPVSADGVTWTDSDRDALIQAIVDVFSNVGEVTTVIAHYFDVRDTDVTPSST